MMGYLLSVFLRKLVNGPIFEPSSTQELNADIESEKITTRGRKIVDHLHDFCDEMVLEIFTVKRGSPTWAQRAL